MDIKLDFDPKEVAESLQKAIMTSTFKEMFTKAAEQEMAALTKSTGWDGANSALRDAVRQFMARQLVEVLEAEYKDKIKAGIRKWFEAEQLDQLIDKFSSKLQFSNY